MQVGVEMGLYMCRQGEIEGSLVLQAGQKGNLSGSPGLQHHLEKDFGKTSAACYQALLTSIS